MSFDGSRAEFYRNRAIALHKMANEAHDPGIKEQFAIIAREYEKLAKSVERGTLGR